jgi:adenylosuccinate lyase|tara:strand:+ start:199 stop:411 length:213 start_codon:yes stop_codon:yes gene_type:complete
MSEENLVEKVRELEMALCQANGKLFAIQDACEREIINSEEAMEDVTDGSEAIYEGRVEFAMQIADYLEEK